ncbi:hypothetical protein GEMRC1_012151 [Eukaryota sp. GEM-RC1]
MNVISLSSPTNVSHSRFSSLAYEFWNPGQDITSRRVAVLEFLSSQLMLNPLFLSSVTRSEFMTIFNISMASLHLPFPLNLPAIVLTSKVISYVPFPILLSPLIMSWQTSSNTTYTPF